MADRIIRKLSLGFGVIEMIAAVGVALFASVTGIPFRFPFVLLPLILFISGYVAWRGAR